MGRERHKKSEIKYKKKKSLKGPKCVFLNLFQSDGSLRGSWGPEYKTAITFLYSF